MDIRLRAPEEHDVDRLFLWDNDRDFQDAMPQSAPLSRLMMWEYIKNYQADPFTTKELRMVVTDGVTDDAIGYIDMFDFDPVNRRAGIGIYVDESWRRKGVALAALAAFEHYACATLGLHQLWAQIAVDNAASLALFRRAGFKPCGKLRSWLRRGTSYGDALVFQKLFW